MRIAVRAAAVVVAAVAAVAAALATGAAGFAAAQPVPPEPPPNQADEAAQLACVQRYLDLTTLPQQALSDPMTFSMQVAQAAAICEDVRAPAPAGTG